MSVTFLQRAAVNKMFCCEMCDVGIFSYSERRKLIFFGVEVSEAKPDELAFLLWGQLEAWLAKVLNSKHPAEGGFSLEPYLINLFSDDIAELCSRVYNQDH